MKPPHPPPIRHSLFRDYWPPFVPVGIGAGYLAWTHGGESPLGINIHMSALVVLGASTVILWMRAAQERSTQPSNAHLSALRREVADNARLIRETRLAVRFAQGQLDQLGRGRREFVEADEVTVPSGIQAAAANAPSGRYGDAWAKGKRPSRSEYWDVYADVMEDLGGVGREDDPEGGVHPSVHP